MIVSCNSYAGIEHINSPFPRLRAKLRYFGRILKLAARQFVETEVNGRVMRIKAIVAFLFLYERYGNCGGSLNAAPVQIHTFKYLSIFYGVIFSFRFIHFYFDFTITFFNNHLPSVEVEGCVLRDAFLCHDCH